MTTKRYAAHLAACLGAATRPERTTEYMETCRLCGTGVRHDLIDHYLFGFKAGCDRFPTTPEPAPEVKNGA